MEKTDLINSTTELTFKHNLRTVDVILWDSEGFKLTIVKNQDADIFLAHFDYGECQCNDIDIIVNYLNIIL